MFGIKFAIATTYNPKVIYCINCLKFYKVGANSKLTFKIIINNYNFSLLTILYVPTLLNFNSQ